MIFLHAQMFLPVHVKRVHIMVMLVGDKSGDSRWKSHYIFGQFGFVCNAVENMSMYNADDIITAINEAMKQRASIETI